MESVQKMCEEIKKEDDIVSQISMSVCPKKKSTKKIAKIKEPKEMQHSIKCFLGLSESKGKKIDLVIDLIKLFKENVKVMDLKRKYMTFKFSNVVMNIRVNQEGESFIGHELSWTCSDKPIVWSETNNFTPNRQWLDRKNQINLNLSMTQWASFESLENLNGKMGISIKSNDEVDFKACIDFAYNFSVKGEKSEDGFSSVMDIMKFN